MNTWIHRLLPLLGITTPLSAPLQSRASGLLVAAGGFGGELTIEEHTVDVTINNGVAVTHVTQAGRHLRQCDGDSAAERRAQAPAPP